jgi:hypothetical protein
MPDNWSLPPPERIAEILKRAEPWVPTFTKILTALVVPASLLYLLPSFLGLFAAPLDPHIDLYAVNRPIAFTFLDAAGDDIGHRGAVVGEKLKLEDMPPYLPAAFTPGDGALANVSVLGQQPASSMAAGLLATPGSQPTVSA